MSRRSRSDRRVRVPASRKRSLKYRYLENTLTTQSVYSEDQLESVHQTALRVLEELGIRVLNEEARKLYRKAGAEVDHASQMVCLSPELVTQSLQTASAKFLLRGGVRERDVWIGGKHIVFNCVGGAPHISDLDNGKRTATLKDTRNLIRLSEHFDVMHLQTSNVESQDIAPHIRHLHVTESQATLSNKPLFVYARGAQQVEDGFEIVRLARGLSEQQFIDNPYCYTVVNTNSPRQIDNSMSQGIIDFARAGQMCVITPFTLAGAMAPVTITGALVLQHAEALAGIVLSQITRAGAPVVYGSFTSNVDMRSGSPAFGTPEYVQAAMVAGQLARRIGLPWRGSAATSSNIADEQSVYETLMSAWGSLLGGVNMMVHSAGWLVGGLTGSYEKFILDVEMLQIIAETLQPVSVSEKELAFDAIASVEPGGHFFGCDHTMERYQSAFYEPLVSDRDNFGLWTEKGASTASVRANAIWKQVLADFTPPAIDPGRREAIDEFIHRRTSAGGAPPV